jgi:hypothetical protein
MDNEHRELALELETLPDTDSEELAALVQRLRAELLDLDVDRVEPLTAGEAPEGAKGVELLALGVLVVQFVLQPGVLTSIVDGVRSWLQRQSVRSVKLTLDGDSLEVTGVSSEEQDRLVELWIARNAARR